MISDHDQIIPTTTKHTTKRRHAVAHTAKPFNNYLCKTNNNSRSFSTWRRNMTQDDYVECIKDEIAKLQHILLQPDVKEDIKTTAIHTMEHLKNLLRDTCKYTIRD